MKNPRLNRNTVTAIALAMVMLVILIPFAHAEGPAKGAAKGAEKIANLRAQVRADVTTQSSDKKDQGQYSQDELEQMRSALLDLAGSVSELSQFSPRQFDTGRLDEAIKQIAELPYQQLAVLRKGLSPGRMRERLASVRTSLGEIRSEIRSSVEAQSGLPKANKGVIRPESAGFPEAHPLCHGALGEAHGARIHVLVLEAADGVYFLAETARDLAQDGCNEVIVILGEGGNGRLVCVATDILYIAAHFLWTALHFCNDNFTDEIVDANYDRLTHIHEDLEDSVDNDNSNKTMIVNNDNSNTTAINNNVNTKTTQLSNQISAGTTEILNKIESKGNQIINNDNTNKTMIINNDNTNTANIITNDNANKTTIINNDNANFAATINELRALNCDVIRLLHTPDGQRSSDIASCAGKPGFPYRWNKLNSTPVTPASAKVSAGTDMNPVTDPFSNERGQDGVPILPLMGTVTLERHLLEGRLIPTYYLPASRGGMIELVKLLVWNTIGAQLELNIAKAETEEAKGLARQADELLTQKKYLEAYRQYSVAYQRLVPAN